MIGKIAEFFGLKPWLLVVYAVSALVASGLLFWAYSTVTSWKHDSEALPGVKAELSKVKSDYEEINAAIARQEKALATSKRATDLLSESLKNELSKNLVYRSCIIPAEWMRIRNEIIDARYAK
jgi:hypothetical protein